MNILNKITIRNLKLNKHRTIVTLVGIMLSCALITAVATFVSSFRATLIDYNVKKSGNYHVQINNVKTNDIDAYTNNVEVKEYGISQSIGYAKIDSKNEYKPYMYIKAVNQYSLNNSGIKVISGRLPQNQNELVISEHVNSNGGLKYKVGDNISLDIGKRVLPNGKKLNQDISYNDDNEKNYIENIIDTNNRKYTIVGIIERNYVLEGYSSAGYLAITCLNSINPNENVDLKILLKNPRNVKKYEENVQKNITKLNSENVDTNSYNDDNDVNNDNNDKEIAFLENKELLALEGVINNENTMTTILLLALIVIFVIVITSVIVIRNSFNISITERIKQYGILASIGATPKQIKNNVKYEGLILGIIAIPLGVILGIFAVTIILKLISGILSKYLSDVVFKIYISYIAILASIILSAITIYISSQRPAKKAAKISPISAIKLENEIKIESKKVKVSKLFKKIFGIEAIIALKNLKRSKKKYRTTIVSIFISVVIFIAMDSLIVYAFKFEDKYYQNIQYNLLVRDTVNKTAKATEEYFDKIKKLDNIEKYSIKKELYLNIDSKYINSDISSVYDMKLNQPYVTVISLGQEEFNRYCKKIGVNISSNEAILVDKGTYYKKDKKRYSLDYLNLNEGQTLKGECNDNEKTAMNLTIKKRTDILPMSLIEAPTNTAYVIVSDDYISKYSYSIYYMYIQSNNPDTLEKNIKKIDPTIINNTFNIEEEKDEENAMRLVISIFAYGFIAVISIIGITNIFNTITTNIALRKKEFAILESIGMTSKQFNKMINFESVIYGARSLLFGIPIGIIISYLIYLAVGNTYVESNYTLPFKAILISVVFVFLVIYITMTYSSKKIKRQNIIEAIREENI